MKFDKGLFLDSSKTNQPSGTWRYLLNGTFDRDRNVITDEQGFRSFGKNLPDAFPVGFITINNDVIIFWDNDTIGIVNENGYHDKIVGNSNFNFTKEFPVKGKFIQNFNGERIIVFIDDNNRPKIINIDDIPYVLDSNRDFTGDLNKFLLFPEFIEPRLILPSIERGGSLITGTYYLFFQYENSSTKTTSSWTKQSIPFYIASDYHLIEAGSASNLNSSKSIKFSLNEVDTRFDKLNIAVMTEINGNVSVVQSPLVYEITSSNIDNIEISSNEGTDLTIEEVLINKVNYERIGDLELTQEELLGSNVQESDEINFQPWANMIQINYIKNYENLGYEFQVEEDYPFIQKIGNDKGFRTGEVYSFYCSLVLKKGGESRLFHIPGRPPIAGDKDISDVSDINTNDLIPNQYVYQMENTADKVGALTNMGYWENENEEYPNVNDFNSTSLGGLDLRGQKIRHHRFPDLRSLRDSSPNVDTYGIYEFPILSIVASNIVIPNHIANQIQGIKIYYAKRDIENMTCLGQSPSMYNHYVDTVGVFTFGSPDMYCRAGVGNFRSASSPNFPNYSDQFPIETSIRFYDFALMNNKPSINPDYICNQIYIKSQDVNTQPTSDYVVYDRNYTNRNGPTSLDIIDDDFIQKVINYNYLSKNVIGFLNDNTGGEEFIDVRVQSKEAAYFVAAYNAARSENFSIPPVTEHLYISDLKRILSNAYYGFQSDRDVICTSNNTSGSYLKITSSGVKSTSNLYNGDNFANIHYIRKTAIYFEGMNIPPTDETGDGKGCFSERLVLHESIHNVRYRYIDQSNPNNSYSPLSKGLRATQEFRPEQIFNIYNDYEISYSNDFHSIPILNNSIIYNSFNEATNKHPYRIIRSNVINRETDINLNFAPLSFYELTKKRGEITGINFHNDKLTIRCKNGAFVTRPKQNILTNEENATLGSNDLFQLEPRELITTDNGYIKSETKFDTILTENGLILIDIREGKIFLISDGIKELTSRESGLQNYIADLFYNLNQTSISIKIDYSSKTSLLETYDSSNRIKIKVPIFFNDISTIDFKIGDYLWLDVDQTFCKILNVYVELELSDSYVVLETDHVNSSPSASTNFKHYKITGSYYNNGFIFSWNKRENTSFLRMNLQDSIPESLKDRFVGNYYNTTNFTNNLNVGDIVRYEDDFREWNGSSLNSAITLEDNSKTLSFNFEIGKWISFHSYISDMFCYLGDNLLSFKDKILYKHNQLNRKGQYYSEDREDFIIELIFNNGNELTKKYFSLDWICNFLTSNNILDSTKTFESIQCSNEYDNLGEQILTPFINLLNKGNIRNVKGTWKFNQLKNSENNLLSDKYLSVILKDSDENSLYLYEVNAFFKLLDKQNNV
jgi:hypothetical protein